MTKTQEHIAMAKQFTDAIVSRFSNQEVHEAILCVIETVADRRCDEHREISGQIKEVEAHLDLLRKHESFKRDAMTVIQSVRGPVIDFLIGPEETSKDYMVPTPQPIPSPINKRYTEIPYE